MLPSQRVLQYHKNKVQQSTGINHDNLKWMYSESKKLQLGPDNLNGGLLLDEMSVQKDLQIVRRNKGWQIVGAVDLGTITNSLDKITAKKEDVQLATHCLQYLYLWIWRLSLALCILQYMYRKPTCTVFDILASC